MTTLKMYTQAKDIAQALNFGKYPVLMFDLDSKEGCKVRVTEETRMYGTQMVNCTLQRDKIKVGDGIFYLSKETVMLKAEYGMDDYLKSAQFANAPIIEANQEIAIFHYSKEIDIGFVLMVRSGKIDTSYSSVVTFEPIRVSE